MAESRCKPSKVQKTSWLCCDSNSRPSISGRSIKRLKYQKAPKEETLPKPLSRTTGLVIRPSRNGDSLPRAKREAASPLRARSVVVWTHSRPFGIATSTICAVCRRSQSGSNLSWGSLPLDHLTHKNRKLFYQILTRKSARQHFAYRAGFARVPSPTTQHIIARLAMKDHFALQKVFCKAHQRSL